MDRLLVSQKNGVRIIKFNIPQRRNAITNKVSEELTRIFTEDAQNDNIVVTILTGVGDYFTSGVDIKAMLGQSVEKGVTETGDMAFKNFATALIDYPKIVIAVVNGPAIGMGATVVGLCDIVYASDRATFHTPFLRIGLCCEGCSSLHFPLTMGRSKAGELIFLSKKITAQEAERYGLVSRVIPHQQLDAFIEDLHQYGKLPVEAVKINKKLIMDNYRKWFHNCNENECNALEERKTSDDLRNYIANFMNKKSKM